MGVLRLSEQILTNPVVKRLRPFAPRRLAAAASQFSEWASAENNFRMAMKGDIANSDAILKRLKSSYIPVSCPLILISQVQRSGGSLLSQLFDGHSEVLAHPQELKIGHPRKEVWPKIGSGMTIDQQFRILFELPTIRMCQSGYAKGRRDLHPKNFFLMPQMQRELFRDAAEKFGRASSRAVLNAYFTSYFNAWLNLRTDISRAKFVSGFVPMLMAGEDNMKQYWTAYPDGYLISIIRSPFSWYPSAARLADGRKLADIEKAADRWCESTQAIIREKQRNPERVIVLHFDELVTNTEGVMRLICDRIGLAFEPTLLSPTFNGSGMGANTSFEKVEQGTVSSAPTSRDEHLTDEHRRYLEERCQRLYQQALETFIDAPSGSRAA